MITHNSQLLEHYRVTMLSIKYTAIGQRGQSWPDNQSSQNTLVAGRREGTSPSIVMSRLKSEHCRVILIYRV